MPVSVAVKRQRERRIQRVEVCSVRQLQGRFPGTSTIGSLGPGTCRLREGP
ncbi:MAG TPA: hypothetical protein VGH51_21865 [Candidatus Angelobacter sp.]